MLLILLGIYLWIGQGRKIRMYIEKGILATKGGYGIVRNPIYSGILFVLTGIFLAIQSWIMLATIPINYLVLKILLKREDDVLIHVFGQKYTDYKKQVNPIIPKLKSFYSAFFYPADTDKTNDNLFVIRDGYVNFFVYKTEKSTICFDTGSGNKQTVHEFEKLGLKTTDVSAVFLTHSDRDHTKGLHFFEHAKIYIGENEAPLVTGKKTRFLSLFKNKQIEREYSLLKNNQVLMIDNTKVEAIFTPGHTIGHVSYLIDNKILISGDSVVLQNGSLNPMYRVFNMNHRLAKESAKQIDSITGISFICSSHTGIVKTNDYNN